MLRGGEIDIVDDRQVEAAVEVEVGEAAAHAPFRIAQSSVGGRCVEAGARAEEQDILPESGDVEVEVAVVVDVGGACSHGVAVEPQAPRFGDLFEGTVAAITKGLMMRWLFFRCPLCLRP